MGSCDDEFPCLVQNDIIHDDSIYNGFCYKITPITKLAKTCEYVTNKFYVDINEQRLWCSHILSFLLLGLKVFLDIKGSRPITMAKVLKAMVEEFPDLHEWAVVCSFYPHLLYAVKWSLPQFVTILTHR